MPLQEVRAKKGGLSVAIHIDASTAVTCDLHGSVDCHFAAQTCRDSYWPVGLNHRSGRGRRETATPYGDLRRFHQRNTTGLISRNRVGAPNRYRAELHARSASQIQTVLPRSEPIVVDGCTPKC